MQPFGDGLGGKRSGFAKLAQAWLPAGNLTWSPASDGLVGSVRPAADRPWYDLEPEVASAAGWSESRRPFNAPLDPYAIGGEAAAEALLVSSPSDLMFETDWVAKPKPEAGKSRGQAKRVAGGVAAAAVADVSTEPSLTLLAPQVKRRVDAPEELVAAEVVSKEVVAAKAGAAQAVPGATYSSFVDLQRDYPVAVTVVSIGGRLPQSGELWKQRLSDPSIAPESTASESFESADTIFAVRETASKLARNAWSVINETRSAIHGKWASLKRRWWVPERIATSDDPSPETPLDASSLAPRDAQLRQPSRSRMDSVALDNRSLPPIVVDLEPAWNALAALQPPEMRVASASRSAKPKPEAAPTAWPRTPSLLTTLDSLLQDATEDDRGESSTPGDTELTRWVSDVRAELQRLGDIPRLGDVRAAEALDRLQNLATMGLAMGEAVPERERQRLLLTAAHAVTRRVGVWRAVFDVVSAGIHHRGGDDPAFPASSGDVAGDDVAGDDVAGVHRTQVHADAAIVRSLDRVQAVLRQNGDAENWSTFLGLDKIRVAASGAAGSESIDRHAVAMHYLHRIRWHDLRPNHRRLLADQAFNTLAEQLRPWTSTAIDYVKLLSQLESRESDSLHRSGKEIAMVTESLSHDPRPEVAKIATEISRYYRNANVRLAVSADLVNRMMPTLPVQSMPVRATILGSRVRGTSDVQSELAVELIPSRDRWRLNLQTLGNVQTRSTGYRDGVSLATSGENLFRAAKPIEITPAGLRARRTDVDVRGWTQLRGVQTQYDRVPLVGTLVSSIARGQFERTRPLAQRIASRRIENEIRQNIDQRFDAQWRKAEERLTTMVVRPLDDMRLEPSVLDMQTTDQRLLARYRLADDMQMAAASPRPRAPVDSLVSLQIHESAINNTMSRLIPRSRAIAVGELIERCAESMGRQVTLSDDLPDDVSIRMTPDQPVTVQMRDGYLTLTIRVVSLQRGRDRPLTKFIVEANYLPRVEGKSLLLVRDGHLSIRGPRMAARERFPIRTIFNKVLSKSRPIRLDLPVLGERDDLDGVEVVQFELQNGWLAAAVADRKNG